MINYPSDLLNFLLTLQQVIIIINLSFSLTSTAWNPKVTQKQYSLGDLWLFLDSHLNPSKYPENKYYEDMRKFGLQIVTGYDKGKQSIEK